MTAALSWDRLPAAQQPDWRDHPAYPRTRAFLAAATPLVTPEELTELRGDLAKVAAGEAQVLQIGDCAENFYECTPARTRTKIGVLEDLGDHLAKLTGRPVVRIGRLGGQFGKPRSEPTEVYEGVELPTFRGHLVNSEIPTRAARRHDPRRLLWAYEASAEVTGMVREHRSQRDPLHGSGPWSSHEALVLDYEGPLLRPAPDGTYLGSTHLPWIGERTRQTDAAHVHLLASVLNPVGCKVGPTATPAGLLELCELLDPAREPGRLVLISRMGRGLREALPPLLRAVRRAGHQAVWLCDPMHGNTVKTGSGVKTRLLPDIVAELTAFREVLLDQGQVPGGVHLEASASPVTECVGHGVAEDDLSSEAYTTLCDPRLDPEQTRQVLSEYA
ncbi:3-deoxy-7-phosphoheptulonate synthase [Longispora sp. NPDC051575]|uniref:3-deoxy-7-phosphoheptulonate synthase n=1 Tax=Longispora sp. NPDC051575 TaxID=3154943 RepID=UPI0034281EC1